MVSPLEGAIVEIQGNNLTSLAIVTAIGYDYILTFPREVEYVWDKPWTLVSMLFFLARYFGLCGVICLTIWGTSFLPGPETTYVFMRVYILISIAKLIITLKQIVCADQNHLLGELVYLLGVWSSWIFMCSADREIPRKLPVRWVRLIIAVAMILRIWALYNRSKLTLWILLVFYAIEVVSNLISYVLVSAQFRSDPAVDTAQVLDYSFCVWANFSPIWGELLDVIQIILGALMCLFVIVRFVKESIQMYEVTRQFHLNHYVNLLVRQGMLYFIAILGYALAKGLGNMGFIPIYGPPGTLVGILSHIPAFILIPRFILSLRELHARELRRRRGSELDTAFGLISMSAYHAAASTMIFTETGLGDAETQGDDMQMEDADPVL